MMDAGYPLPRNLWTPEPTDPHGSPYYFNMGSANGSELSPGSLSPPLTASSPSPSIWNSKSTSLPAQFRVPSSFLPPGSLLNTSASSQQMLPAQFESLSLQQEQRHRMHLQLQQQQQQQQRFLRSHSYPEKEAAIEFQRSLSDGQVRMLPQQQQQQPFSMAKRPITGGARGAHQKPQMILENSDSSDEDSSPSHPNKYSVAIEEHRRPECRYKRQSSRSGSYVKVTKDSGESFCLKHNPNEPLDFDNGKSQDRPQIVKYYRKDLVRVCRCGEYMSMEHMLDNSGRANDSEGYEIHYSQKCKWKFYEDFKTKKRVLIRLCKCYKPAV